MKLLFDISNSTKCLPVLMTMRIWSMVEGSLNYLRVGRRNKGNTGEGKEGRGLSRRQRVCLVSCCLRVGCFCRCFGCFGIFDGGELKGTRKRYYGGDILAGVCSWWRAKTPPTTEWFSPAMVNTSARWSPSPTLCIRVCHQ